MEEPKIVMSIKISTLLSKVDSILNRQNASIIMDFYGYMQYKGSSENHKINNLKVILGAYISELFVARTLPRYRYHKSSIYCDTTITFFKSALPPTFNNS